MPASAPPCSQVTTSSTTVAAGFAWLSAVDWVRGASVVKDLTLSAAAIVTACVAVPGLRTWRRQLKGTTEYQVAHRVLKAIALVQDAIADCRAPVTISEEWQGRPRQERDTAPRGGVEDQFYAYLQRFKSVQSACSKLHLAELDAVALWGNPARQRLLAIARHANGLYHAARTYYPLKLQEEGMPARRNESVEAVGRDLHSHVEGDTYAEELGRIVLAAEDFLRPHLK